MNSPQLQPPEPALVLLTGASGFIAKHVTKLLLQQTHYKIRATVRNPQELECARKAIATYHSANDSNGRIEFITADLLQEEGWKEAVHNVKYVLHIASPYPLQSPRNREALVPIARDGTLRVLTAALESPTSTVQRVILVSSMVACMYQPHRPATTVHVTEQDWTDPDWDLLTSYVVSKTRAERAAWQYVRSLHKQDFLVVVNPAMVWGSLLDATPCTSSGIAQLFLTGTYPAVPPVAYPIVDVRDVAQVLVTSLTAPHVGGRRLLCAADTLSLRDVARVLKEACPTHASRVPSLELPKFLVRLWAPFDPALQPALPDLDTRVVIDSTYVTELTGVVFRPAAEAVAAMGQSLVNQGMLAGDGTVKAPHSDPLYLFLVFGVTLSFLYYLVFTRQAVAS